MATQLQIRRGTNSQVAAFTGAEGEIVVNTTNDSVHVNDGSTAGGFEMARADLNNVSDTSLNAALTGNTVSALTITTLTLGSTAITATGAELNILDGVTSTAAELNILDGVTATTAELNIMDGVTSTTAELNILDGVTATATELNLLDGVTATTAELNYVDGVTSAIQTQIDTKAPLASPTFTGNVGIGVSSPTARLSLPAQASGDSGVARFAIESAVDSNDFTISQYEDGSGTYTLMGQNISLNSGGNVTVLDSAHKTAGVLFDGRGNGQLQFYTGAANASSSKMTVTSSGAVGIGLSNPTEKLTVVNSSSGIVGRFTNNVNQTLDLGVVSGSGAAGGVYYNSANSGYHAFQTGGTERMRIDSSGNMGIGTSATSAKVIIDRGAGSSSPTTFTTANSYLQLGGSDYNSSGSVYAIGFGYSGGATNSPAYMGFQLTGVGSYTKGDLVFRTRDSTDDVATTERLRIDSSGALVLNNSGGDAQMYLGGSSGSDRMYLARSGNDSLLWNVDSGVMRFGTNNAEAMRIDSSGCLLRNTTSSTVNSSGGEIVVLNDGNRAAINVAADSTSSRTGIVFTNPNGTVGSISMSGSATAYNTSSDYRLKENVVAMSGATDRLKQLKPSRFNFIADADTTVDGFLAHEVQNIVPEAITGAKDAVDADGNPDYQGIDQSKLVPLLVATIQELEARLTALENN